MSEISQWHLWNSINPTSLLFQSENGYDLINIMVCLRVKLRSGVSKLIELKVKQF